MTNKSIRDYINLIENAQRESVTEMDKSAPQPGRDGRVSHSTYGSRDKGGSKGPEREARPVTAKKAAQHALDILKKQGVAEGLPQTLRKVVPGYAKREIDKKMDAEKFGRRDVDKDANYWRYKKIQDKLKKQGVAEGQLDEAKIASTEEEDFFRNGKKVGSITKVTLKSGIIYYSVQVGNSHISGADTRQEALRDLKQLLRDNQGVAEEQLEETTPEAIEKVNQLYRN